MGTLLLHPGMPKAGSSAIQRLLAEHADELADVGVVTAVGRHTENGELAFTIARGRANNSVDVVHGLRDAARRGATLATFRSEIRALLEQNDTVVVTSEALAQPFWQGDADFLRILDVLSHEHVVRVAYYVRPQHTALEAAWRQWGYRSGVPAGRYMQGRARMMAYDDTANLVGRLAPAVDFVTRPFRRDMLVGGDVGQDFLATFLPSADVSYEPAVANAGLPLGLVNLLALGSSSPLWDSAHDNTRLDILKRVVESIDVPSDDHLSESRRLLQQLCHERYEPGNRALADRIGWDLEAFVPPADIEVGGRRMAEFDELWRPAVEPAVVLWIHTVLAATVEQRQELSVARRRVAAAEARTAEATERATAAAADLERLRNRRVVRAGLRLARLAGPLIGRSGRRP